MIGAVATASALMAVQGASIDISFNFGTSSGTTSPTAGTPSNFTVGDITLGNTLGSIASNPNITNPSSGYTGASGNFNYDQITQNGASLNTSTSAYYQFTVTPDPGFFVQITDFDFGALSTTTTGPLSYVLRWSVDNYAANVTSVGSLTRGTAWALKNNTFTAKTSTTSGAAVDFRLYFYNTTAAVSGTPNVSIDDVKTSLAAVPEASGCAGLVGLTWLHRRVKRAKQQPKT